jgi:hypothetical protein
VANSQAPFALKPTLVNRVEPVPGCVWRNSASHMPEPSPRHSRTVPSVEALASIGPAQRAVPGLFRFGAHASSVIRPTQSNNTN